VPHMHSAARWIPAQIDCLPALMAPMPELPTKITLGEMRASGVRGLLIYCAARTQLGSSPNAGADDDGAGPYLGTCDPGEFELSANLSQ